MSNFTDATYDVTQMGTPAPLGYSLSAVNNYFNIVSTGTFNGSPVIGVLYNVADFSTAVSLLTSTATITLSSPGDTSTVINLLSGVPAGVTLAVINVNSYGTSFTALSSSTTIILRVSAGSFDFTDPNGRRLWNLNG